MLFKIWVHFVVFWIMLSKNSFHWRVSSQSQRNVVYRTVQGRKLTVPIPAIMVLNFKWFRGVCMRSEDNFVEFILISLGIKLRLSGLYARSFTHWAISIDQACFFMCIKRTCFLQVGKICTGISKWLSKVTQLINLLKARTRTRFVLASKPGFVYGSHIR